ncbi:DUF2851 family protein [Lacihabitans sp. LS3-19]|uniref:DUF2851 family protein n=1 Tax=Lacihabitans sp. LS3-19 TaxID=2487335 RepID=UPI0020CEFBA7|nr:DUF2851 family protein [Lacihabitans sp. LS3-19]MCP9767409.1 DUF2851 family protein [Lacihabitans sp. LS3-19]
MKNEDFIHYTWQFQQFDKTNLKTTEGQNLAVIKAGYRNPNSGPDFENCRISIADIDWAGKVEMHIKSSDWNRHNHQRDAAYENVILHVVWEHDLEVYRLDGTLIPTLEIKDLVYKETLEKYENLLRNPVEIPCEQHIPEVSDLAKLGMFEKALAHRLEQKSQGLKEILLETNNDFEELTYRVLARNMGFKLNSEAFLRLAEVLPFKIIQKHKGNLTQIEALLFGQAGFLDTPKDEYAKLLATEYAFLSQKYGLNSTKMERMQWRFLRTRPNNFPTIRIAQFAAILNSNYGLFSLFIENAEKKVLETALKVKPSDYWTKHYDFGKTLETPSKCMGESSVNNILINTCVQLLAFYADEVDQHTFFEKAIKILETIKPETNFITKKWQNLGFKISSAFDSQASIEQYNHFCTHKRCLQCPIGIEILKKPIQ